MNIYANCPGIGRMISELGKKIAFVNNFHGSDNKTYNYSFFTSLLIHCRRRAGQQSEKLTKSGKKYHSYPSQLTYAHWVNCILDSRAIIRRHDLIPELSNDSNLKEMFPPLSAIVDHFKAKDKTKTKQPCNDVIQCFFVPGKTDFLELYLYAYLTNSHSTTNLRPS